MDSYLKNSGLLTFRGIDGFETEQLSIETNRSPMRPNAAAASRLQ